MNVINPKFDAIILSGGKGSRLAPITHTIPKGLIDIAGRPLVSRLIDTLDSTDYFEHYILTISYLAERYRSTNFNSKVILKEDSNGCNNILCSIIEATDIIKNELVFGISSDVVINSKTIKFACKKHVENKNKVSLFLNKIYSLEPRKWDWIYQKNKLLDVNLNYNHYYINKYFLIFNNFIVTQLKEFYGTEFTPDEFKYKVPEIYNNDKGWILLIKLMLLAKIPVNVYFLDHLIINVNTFEDLEKAKTFYHTAE